MRDNGCKQQVLRKEKLSVRYYLVVVIGSKNDGVKACLSHLRDECFKQVLSATSTPSSVWDYDNDLALALT